MQKINVQHQQYISDTYQSPPQTKDLYQDATDNLNIIANDECASQFDGF